jgi:hypothetical protein
MKIKGKTKKKIFQHSIFKRKIIEYWKNPKINVFI